MIAYGIVAFFAAQRLAEMVIARRNTQALLARGAIEIAPGHYPLFILLHASWLTAIAFLMPTPAPVYWIPLAGCLVLQGLRAWTVVSLGPFWTTRIITMPNAPLVRRGPYCFVRHPNYLIVIGEIALLPSVFGEISVAIVFSVLNAMLLAWRVRAEDGALAARRALD